MFNIHNNRLYHGAIKSSNILLTSQNHVIIADFDHYRPIQIQNLN